MKSAQFYKGMINGTEDSYESPDLLQVIPKEKLPDLWDIDEIGTYSRVFLKERIIAKTIVFKPEDDILGRSGIINHTVLYRFDLYTVKDGVRYKFDEEQFLQDAREDRFNFEMPPKPELKIPLDLPPPLEVNP